MCAPRGHQAAEGREAEVEEAEGEDPRRHGARSCRELPQRDHAAVHGRDVGREDHGGDTLGRQGPAAREAVDLWRTGSELQDGINASRRRLRTQRHLLVS